LGVRPHRQCLSCRTQAHISGIDVRYSFAYDHQPVLTLKLDGHRLTVNGAIVFDDSQHDIQFLNHPAIKLVYLLNQLVDIHYAVLLRCAFIEMMVALLTGTFAASLHRLQSMIPSGLSLKTLVHSLMSQPHSVMELR
jgi:hypothetical protein